MSRDPSTGQGLPGSALQRLGKVDESSALPAGRRDGVNQNQNYHLFALLLLPFRKSSVLKKGADFTEAEVTLGAGGAAGTDWLPAGSPAPAAGAAPWGTGGEWAGWANAAMLDGDEEHVSSSRDCRVAMPEQAPVLPCQMCAIGRVGSCPWQWNRCRSAPCKSKQFWYVGNRPRSQTRWEQEA